MIETVLGEEEEGEEWLRKLERYRDGDGGEGRGSESEWERMGGVGE